MAAVQLQPGAAARCLHDDLVHRQGCYFFSALHLAVAPRGAPRVAARRHITAAVSESPQKTWVAPSFPGTLKVHGLDCNLERTELSTLQVNVGLYCNQACAHCHVDSSPRRTEMMERQAAERLVALLEGAPFVRTVDLTGGAPELNPEFRYLVRQSRRLGKEVIDRCNLTVLFEPGQEDLAGFLVEHRVRVVASLPCYSASNVDKQRGKGVFELSIQALQQLNALGYGKEGTGLVLDLVYNPVGPTLPPSQVVLEAAYKNELWSCYGVQFNQLFTITNMPIKRFRDDLVRHGRLGEYMDLLASSFNPAAVDSIMCRNLISIGWDGAIFDCDFNQQLGLQEPGAPRTIFDLESLDQLVGRPIAVGSHCLGCTAGQGSSCTGAVVP